MPWSHCGNDGLLDNRRCPSCGRPKDRWTVTLERTKVLRVGDPDAALEVRLVDEGGEPVEGASLLVEPCDGSLRAGQVDAAGVARVLELPHGPCRVSFPDLEPGELLEEAPFEPFDLAAGANVRAFTLRWTTDAGGQPEDEWGLDGEGAVAPAPPPPDDRPFDQDWELAGVDGEGEDGDAEWRLDGLDPD